MNQLIIDAVIFSLGAIIGVCMEKASLYLIKRRENTLRVYQFSGSEKKTLFWAGINGTGWLMLIKINGLEANTLECMLLLSVCIVLSVVDMSIKKIPNELIILTLIIGAAFSITSQPIWSLGINVFGLGLGFIIFFLPAIIGKGAGWGDVKFAAAVGFCLGVYGILSAVLIMAICLLGYIVYLIISGKGNLKTRVALGPFIASGFISVLILNNMGLTV